MKFAISFSLNREIAAPLNFYFFCVLSVLRYLKLCFYDTCFIMIVCVLDHCFVTLLLFHLPVLPKLVNFKVLATFTFHPYQ